MSYAIVCHQTGSVNVIDESDSITNARQLFQHYITSDPEWDKENDVEGYELLEWDGDTIEWHSLID